VCSQARWADFLETKEHLISVANAGNRSQLEDESNCEHTQRLIAFYHQYRPEKLKGGEGMRQVHQLIAQYQGQEEELFKQLQTRYTKQPDEEARGDGDVGKEARIDLGQALQKDTAEATRSSTGGDSKGGDSGLVAGDGIGVFVVVQKGPLAVELREDRQGTFIRRFQRVYKDTGLPVPRPPQRRRKNMGGNGNDERDDIDNVNYSKDYIHGCESMSDEDSDIDGGETEPGPLEATGAVFALDYLVSINGIIVTGLEASESVRVIKESGYPVRLQFVNTEVGMLRY
jgi:hypothetical protein